MAGPPPTWDWSAPLRIAGTQHETAWALTTVTLPSGRVLIVGGGNGLVHRWDAATGAPLGPSLGQPDTHSGPLWAVTSIRLPDGRVAIVSGGEDGTIRRWDAVTGQSIGQPITGHNGAVRALTTAVLPDGSVDLVSGGDDGTIRRWDPVTGDPVGVPNTGHTGPVRSLASATFPDRQVVVLSGGDDGTLRTWDVQAGKPMAEPVHARGGPVWALAVSAATGGPLLVVTAGEGGAVRRWEPLSGISLTGSFSGHEGHVRSLASAVLPDGRPMIVSGGEDRTVRRWDARTGEALGDPLPASADVRAVTCAVLPNGRVVIAASGDWGDVQRWDAETGASLTGHDDAVRCLTSAALPDGRVIVISGAADGVLRRWDAQTGEPIGDPLPAHAGGVSAVATIAIGGDVHVVSGGLDGTLARWDAATGQPVGDPLIENAEPVLSLTTVETADSPLIISGDREGVLRRWDARTGESIGVPGYGHDGGVVALTSYLPRLEVIFDRVVVVSGGTDGTIRQWRTDDGVAEGPVILADPVGSVGSLTVVRPPDGRDVIVCGGLDGTIRRWDAHSGEKLDTPAGHGKAVWSLTPVVLDEQRVLVVQGSGELRRWDALTGQEVGEPPAGTGDVRAATAVTMPDGRLLIVTGEQDGTITFWPLLTTGELVGEEAPSPGLDTVSLTDETGDESFRDVLGRSILAAHMEALLTSLLGKQRAGTAVIHVDGRWGSGKSTLVRLLLRQMVRPVLPILRPRKPVVVRYDAWRESAVAPEWWSLAIAINRAVRAERAAAVRAAMTVLSTVNRVIRSIPVLIASALLATTIWARLAGVWTGDIQALGNILTVLTTVATLGLATGRVLFWSAPAFGRLHVRSEDNPLGEIAAVVASIRRWSPRDVRGQRAADTVFALGLVGALAWVVTVAARADAVRTDLADGRAWLVAHAQPAIGAALVALLVGGTWLRRAPEGTARRSVVWRRLIRRVPVGLRRLPRGTGRRARAAVLRVDSLTGYWGLRRVRILRARTARAREALRGVPPADRRVAGLLTLAAVVATFLLLSASGPSGLWRRVERAPYWWALTPLAVVLAAYAAWVVRRLDRPRRPVLLVVDDLDRCAADRVVKLLETVHTLLREPPDVAFFPRWRAAAPLMVLVLGDGRWIRRSFETVYEKFEELGSGVHGLGADFLQKVFDHVVLVPALAADQVQDYVDDVTLTSQWALAARRRRLAPPGAVAPPLPPPPPPRRPERMPTDDELMSLDLATEFASEAIASASPGQVQSDEVRQAVGQAPAAQRQRLAEEVVTRVASPEAAGAFREHLLAGYAPVMPANPRLVNRVVNTFLMLHALALHLGHGEPEDYIVRAAIIFVRFPSLVDELLSDPDPPVIDPAEKPESLWLRRDVQQVLRDDEGRLIDVVRVARCYGREYAPGVPGS